MCFASFRWYVVGGLVWLGAKRLKLLKRCARDAFFRASLLVVVVVVVFVVVVFVVYIVSCPSLVASQSKKEWYCGCTVDSSRYAIISYEKRSGGRISYCISSVLFLMHSFDPCLSCSVPRLCVCSVSFGRASAISLVLFRCWNNKNNTTTKIV